MPCAHVYARLCFGESHSLALECKVGGNFHQNMNILLSPIANKYHEGNMKRTLKRELKESAFAEQKPNRIDFLGKIVAPLSMQMHSWAWWFLPCMPMLFLQSLPLHVNVILLASVCQHVLVMIHDVVQVSGGPCICFLSRWNWSLSIACPCVLIGNVVLLDPSCNTDQGV